MSRKVQCKEEDCDLFIEVEINELPGNFLIFKAALGNFSEKAISEMKDKAFVSPLEMQPRPKEFIILSEQQLLEIPDPFHLGDDAIVRLKVSDFIFRRNKKKKEIVLYITCANQHTHPYKTQI